MGDLFDDSDDNMSDGSLNDYKRHKQRLSVNNRKFLDVEENDDEREKRFKRKSIGIDQLGVSSPSGKGTRPISNPSITMTNDQVTAHYGTCIQLASENKINQKNAFKLHLIDYLKDHVAGLQNFQIATTSLDAGSKIYAGRVDNVHQNTYQVLTGLGNTSNDKAKEGSNDEPIDDTIDDAVDDNENQPKPKKGKRRLNINKNLYVTDLRKNRLSKSSFSVEIDPLFQSQAEKFDDCGVGQLRLNNLKFIERIGELLIDSDTIVFSDYDDTEFEAKKVILETITEFNDQIIELTSRPIPISSHFEDFRFTGWQPGNATMNLTTAESVKLMKEVSKKAEEMALDVQNYDAAFGLMDNDDDHYEPMDFDVGNGVDPVNPNSVLKKENVDNNEIENVKHDDDDLLNGSLTLGTNRGEGSHFLKSISSFVQSAKENQEDNYIAMWAGPDHFKQKTKKIVSEIDALDKQKAKRDILKKEKEKKPLFPKEMEFVLDKNGVYRIKYDEGKLRLKAAPESSIQLTEDCLNKNIKKEYMLPPTVSKKQVGSINEMMRRKISLLSNTFLDEESLSNTKDSPIKSALVLGGPPETVNIVDCNNDDFENRDQLGENQTDAVIIDAAGNVMRADDAKCDMNEYNDDDDGGGDAYMGNMFTNFEADLNPVDNEIQNDEIGATQNLNVPLVKQVAHIDIQYAKSAKRINVKRLKREISDKLTETIGLVEIDELKAKQNQVAKDQNILSALPMLGKSTTLSDILQTVDKRVSTEMANDLSVPIVLTCLLFLSNEKGLNLNCLTEEESFNDIKVGQGYSDYDIEQLKKFGITNINKQKRVANHVTPSGDSPRLKGARKNGQLDIFEDDDGDDDDDDSTKSEDADFIDESE